MSDIDKKTGETEDNSDKIVEETMREIYSEIHAMESSPQESEAENEEADGDDSGEKEPAEAETETTPVKEKKKKKKKKDKKKSPEETKKKKRGWKRKLTIVFGSMLGILVLAYLGVSVFFMNHFYINTEINGTVFSAKTAGQVEAYMEKQVDDYTLLLKESDGSTEEIAGEDIELEYSSEGTVEKLLKDQNPFLWITALWEKYEIEAPIGVEYDEQKLEEVMNSLNCMNTESQIASVSAVPEFQGSAFGIKEEVIGTQIDTESFKKAVNTAIAGFQPELDMKEKGCYILPKYTKDSQEVIAARDTMNSYLGATVTYDLNPYTEAVDASVISQWLTVDENMNVTFNEDGVRNYVQELANKYNTYGKTRVFTTGYGNTVEVAGGNYGWIIDKDAEYEALLANIRNVETVTREPNYSSRAVSHDTNDFGNTYAEVDLTNQHMFFFQNGQCVLQSDVVTGNPNKGNGTPQGTYVLAYKTKDSVLRGPKLPDGTYEWESPVDFWMPFNGGIGFHDATWQSAFGGSRYLTYGSHGCVNLPYDVAAQLYTYVDAGTPVICHY